MGAQKKRSKKGLAQRGGVKVSIRHAEGTPFVATIDTNLILDHLFKNITDIRVVSVSSGFSMTFLANLRMDDSASIRVRSQIEDPELGRLSQMQMADRDRYVDLGTRQTSCFIKVSIVGSGNYLDSYKGYAKSEMKENDARTEARMQSELYRSLMCVNGGVFIPDVIIHPCISATEWTDLIARFIPFITQPTRDVIAWIDEQLTEDPGRKIHLNIMELIPGAFSTVSALPHGSPQLQQALLRTAASIVVLEAKGGTVLYDASTGNAVALQDGSAVQLIDFDRALNLHNSYDVKILREAFKALPSWLNMSLREFFGSINLTQAFDAEIEFLKTHGAECCTLMASSRPHDRTAYNNIHRILMLTALIDFTMNKHKYDSDVLQCGTIMRQVYPVPHMFDNIGTFLTSGRLSLDEFIKLHPLQQSRIMQNLQTICGFIEPMITACPRMGPQRPGTFRLEDAPDSPTRKKQRRASPTPAVAAAVVAAAVAAAVAVPVEPRRSSRKKRTGGRRRRTLRRRFNT